jgi:nucleoid DNA-binding protein
MRKIQFGARAGLLALVGLMAVVAASAQAPEAPKKQTLEGRVATASKQKRDTVTKVLKALGPAVAAQLQAGEPVTLPGLGTFRVVRVAAHRDMIGGAGGRVIKVPGANYIEFVPTGQLEDAANAPGATPSRTVPGFEYIPNPYQVPALKAESLKVGRTRTR